MRHSQRAGHTLCVEECQLLDHKQTGVLLLSTEHKAASSRDKGVARTRSLPCTCTHLAHQLRPSAASGWQGHRAAGMQQAQHAQFSGTISDNAPLSAAQMIQKAAKWSRLTPSTTQR
jgi:hypothetical protein